MNLRSLLCGAVLAVTLLVLPAFGQAAPATPAPEVPTISFNIVYSVDDSDTVGQALEKGCLDFVKNDTQNVNVTIGDVADDDPNGYVIHIISSPTKSMPGVALAEIVTYHVKGKTVPLYLGAVEGFLPPDRTDVAAAFLIKTAIQAILSTQDAIQGQISAPHSSAADEYEKASYVR